MTNSICELTIDRWEKSGSLPPEIENLTPSEIEEVYDGIPDKYDMVRAALRKRF